MRVFISLVCALLLFGCIQDDPQGEMPRLIAYGTLIVTSATSGKVLSTLSVINEADAPMYVEALAANWGVSSDDVEWWLE